MTQAGRVARLALVLALALVSAACSGAATQESSSGAVGGGDRSAAATEAAAPVDGPDAVSVATQQPQRRTPDRAIDIGHTAVEEDVAAASLWTALLQDRGQIVRRTLVSVEDAYEGLATGALDLYFGARLPDAHATSWQTYEDRVDDVGAWFDDAALQWAVPEYVPVDSIADLRGRSEEFGSRVIGVDEDSVLMRRSRDAVIPVYELQEYELLAGSASDMISELLRSLEAEEPVIVTLWRPHWAYRDLALKPLEDPRGALGAPDSIHVLASTTLAEQWPDVHEALRRFALTQPQVAELELSIRDAGRNEEVEAARRWAGGEQPAALVEQWFGAEAG